MGLLQSSPSSITSSTKEFLCPKGDDEASHALDVDLKGARGWVWYRYRPTWIEAKPFSEPLLDLPIHLVLVQRGEEYLAVYPVSSDSATCHLAAGETLSVEVRRCASGAGRGAVVVSRSREPKDVGDLVRAAIARARKWAGAVRDPKPMPDDSPLNGVGFCTWSSLGESNHVTRAQLSALLTELKNAEIPVQTFVIDDGWLDQKHRKLWSLEANDAFGPLGEAVELVQATFEPLPGVGRCRVGVWLTLNGGYWNGIHPESPLVAKYTCKEYAYSNPYEDGTYWLPEGPAFWTDWFAWLKAQGVSFVKVDNQASLAFIRGVAGQEAAARIWRDLVAASDAVFGPGCVVHCMAHSGFTFNGAQGFARQQFWWRNSDDFGMIHDLRNAHQVFVFSNLANALVSNQLATVPDADMFMSAAQYPTTHAVLRAMFPGPLLLSDKPGEHDLNLVRKLIGKDEHGTWRVVKCESAAELLPRRLLDTSVMEDADGTATWAAVRCGHGALIAAFNCRDVGRKVNDQLTVEDVEDAKAMAGMEGDVVVIRCSLDEGTLAAATIVKNVCTKVVDTTAAIDGRVEEVGHLETAKPLQTVELDCMGVMLWRIVPVSQPFGLVDKFAGLNCVRDGKYQYDGLAAAAGDQPLPRLDGGKSEVGITTFAVRAGDKAR